MDYTSESSFSSYSSFSTIVQPEKFWDDKSIFWETTRRDHLQDTTDLEEEIIFSSAPASIESFSLADPEDPNSDSDPDSDSVDTYSDVDTYNMAPPTTKTSKNLWRSSPLGAPSLSRNQSPSNPYTSRRHS